MEILMNNNFTQEELNYINNDIFYKGHDVYAEAQYSTPKYCPNRYIIKCRNIAMGQYIIPGKDVLFHQITKSTIALSTNHSIKPIHNLNACQFEIIAPNNRVLLDVTFTHDIESIVRDIRKQVLINAHKHEQNLTK